MKKLLIILLVLLLLGGGGFAAWWFYLRPDPDAPPPPPPPPTYSSINIPEKGNDSLGITVIKNGKATAHFYFRIMLIFDDPKKQARVQQDLPAITNDLIIELHNLLARKLVEESNYDINLLQAQLQKVCDRRFGPGVVNQISIANMEQAD
jgi:flagellar basal body-associated protein FliL